MIRIKVIGSLQIDNKMNNYINQRMVSFVSPHILFLLVTIYYNTQIESRVSNI